MKAFLAATALTAFAGTALAGGTLIAQFDLQDHPDANENPPPYGLRVDGIIAPGTATLSINQFSDTVLSVFDDGGILSINIQGTLWGGGVSGGSYISAEAYEIDMNYVVGVSDLFGGWNVSGFDAMNAGTLTRVSDNTEFEIYGMPNLVDNVLNFRPDGYRLDGDDDTWVGRGWITDQIDGTDPLDGERDWIFTAIDREIPAPGAAALLAMGGLLSTRRRR
jgi:hypothetical protein